MDPLQRCRGRSGHDPGVVRGIELGSVARADEQACALVVADLAPRVRARAAVGHDLVVRKSYERGPTHPGAVNATACPTERRSSDEITLPRTLGGSWVGDEEAVGEDEGPCTFAPEAAPVSDPEGLAGELAPSARLRAEARASPEPPAGSGPANALAAPARTRVAPATSPARSTARRSTPPARRAKDGTLVVVRSSVSRIPAMSTIQPAA